MKKISVRTDPDVHQLADTIRQDLIKHPNAADTLEGVVNWWLVRQRYESATIMVRQALEMLVQQGELTKIQRHGSSTVYRAKERCG